MTLNELFAATPPSNKIVWRKSKDGTKKTFETEPHINSRYKLVTREKDGKQQQ